ncbi:hypothetical protein Hdeb2414_s0008g00281131 [Helianthus debilis subsp. tardiflorus]
MGIGFGPSPTGAAPSAISPPSSVLLVDLWTFWTIHYKTKHTHTHIHIVYIYILGSFLISLPPSSLPHPQAHTTWRIILQGRTITILCSLKIIYRTLFCSPRDQEMPWSVTLKDEY